MITYVNSFFEGVGPWILYVSTALWGIWQAQISEDNKRERERAEHDLALKESWEKDLQRYYGSKINSS